MTVQHEQAQVSPDNVRYADSFLRWYLQEGCVDIGRMRQYAASNGHIIDIILAARTMCTVL